MSAYSIDNSATPAQSYAEYKVRHLATLNDAEIASRIRKDIGYLNENLTEAKRRGMSVHLRMGKPGEFGFYSFDEETEFGVAEITKTTKEQF